MADDPHGQRTLSPDPPGSRGPGDPTPILTPSHWHWHVSVVDATGLDDGTGHASAVVAHELRDALESWQRQGITVLYVLPNGRDRWTLVGVQQP